MTFKDYLVFGLSMNHLQCVCINYSKQTNYCFFDVVGRSSDFNYKLSVQL
jgi:hypothetical protein